MKLLRCILSYNSIYRYLKKKWFYLRVNILFHFCFFFLFYLYPGQKVYKIIKITLKKNSHFQFILDYYKTAILHVSSIINKCYHILS